MQQSMLLCLIGLLCSGVILGCAEKEEIAVKRDAIQTLISGKSLTYDDPATADDHFIETFKFNGSWETIQFGEGIVRLSGRWRIAEGQVCVDVNSHPALRPVELSTCRLFKVIDNGHLKIPVLFGNRTVLVKITPGSPLRSAT